MLMDTAAGWLPHELVEVNDKKKLFLFNSINVFKGQPSILE